MSLAQALANIIQQEAQTRGQLGIQKAGVIPNAIQNGAEGLQGALMQMGQRETRQLNNEGLSLENKARTMKLSKAERDTKNEEEIKAILMAIPDGPDAMQKRTEAFVKFWQARDPERALEIQKSLQGEAVARAQLGRYEADTMASRASALKSLQEPTDTSGTPFERWARQNPEAPVKEWLQMEAEAKKKDEPDKSDVKLGETVTSKNRKVATFRRADGTTYTVDLGDNRAPSMAPRGEGGLTPYQSSRQQFELRKEFNGSPIVKEYDDVRKQMARVESAMQQAKTTKNFVAVDQAIINGLNKMIDPNSVVREGEYARTVQASPLLNRAVGKIGQISQGGAGFTAEEREALVKLMRDFNNDAESLYSTHASEYERLADEMGIPKDRVVLKREKVQPKGEKKETQKPKSDPLGLFK